MAIEAEGEIQFEHLYIIPMNGTGVVLDSKIFSQDNIFKTPAFHFNTIDIEEAYRFIKNKGVHLLTETELGKSNAHFSVALSYVKNVTHVGVTHQLHRFFPTDYSFHLEQNYCESFDPN